jgi:hypothetical protein
MQSFDMVVTESKAIIRDAPSVGVYQLLKDGGTGARLR